MYEHQSSPCLGSEAIHLRIKTYPLIKTLTLTLPLLNLLSLLWGSVHQLKFVEVDPGITKVWIKFHRPGGKNQEYFKVIFSKKKQLTLPSSPGTSAPCDHSRRAWTRRGGRGDRARTSSSRQRSLFFAAASPPSQLLKPTIGQKLGIPEFCIYETDSQRNQGLIL